MAIHNFAQVPNVAVERSVMDRTTTVKTTFDESYLIPLFWDEILPGDTMSLRETIFARLITLISPIMDNLWLQTFYFWVPLRIVWNHTREFFGEQRVYSALTAQTEYSIPQILSPNNGADPIVEGSLADYLGLPKGFKTGVGNSKSYCRADVFRAYNKIYNRFFKDQNLIDAALENEGDNIDMMENYPIRKVAKFHDYFTSCLPWPQKGDDVMVPLGDSAPVFGNGYSMAMNDGHQLQIPAKAVSGGFFGATDGVNDPVGASVTTAATTDLHAIGLATKGMLSNSMYSGIYADLTEAVAASVNDLRLSIALQRMMEKDARFGTRYKEYLKGHYGVDFQDQIYEPEYLGGSRMRISVNPVTKTMEDTGTNQVGDLRATGTLAAHNNGFYKSFTEHGIIMALCCVRGDLTYCEGVDKKWTRLLKEDIYDPSLAHIGEQPVYKSELYFSGNSTDSEVFGYQEPWAEYRHFPSKATGLMRPNATLGLTSWTLGQVFGAAQELDQAFIEDATPVVRVIAVTNQDHIKADFRFDIKHARPMPLYSVPGLMDHF